MHAIPVNSVPLSNNITQRTISLFTIWLLDNALEFWDKSVYFVLIIPWSEMEWVNQSCRNCYQRPYEGKLVILGSFWSTYLHGKNKNKNMKMILFKDA